MTDLEKQLEAADKILAGSKINVDELIDGEEFVTKSFTLGEKLEKLDFWIDPITPSETASSTKFKIRNNKIIND